MLKILYFIVKYICFLAIAIISRPSEANAFGTEGHKRIEYWAYSELNKSLEGQEIISKLFEWEIMDGGNSRSPMLRSAFPDFSLERQFYQKRQPYHFMASNEAVMYAAKRGPAANGSTSQRELALMQEALPECYKLLFFLFNEVVQHPRGSRQSGRGLYVLMHIITDSFSAEHTTRNDVNEIKTVKGWRSNRIGWPPNAREQSTDGENLALLHRGMFSKISADECWTNSECNNIKKNRKAFDCELSQVGLKAGEAVHDLLIATYHAYNNKSQIETIWGQYVQNHLMPVGYKVSNASNDAFSNAEGNLIKFNYMSEVNLEPTVKGSISAYDFDRFPRHMISGVIQSRTNHILQQPTFGFSYLFNFVPYTADKNRIKRLPISYGVELLFLRRINSSESDQHSFKPRIKGNLGTYLSFFNNMPFRIYALASFNPLNPLQLNYKPGLGGGIELNRLFEAQRFAIDLNPFKMGRTEAALRVAVGYEFDTGGLPAKHGLCIRFGFNTWHARIPK